MNDPLVLANARDVVNQHSLQSLGLPNTLSPLTLPPYVFSPAAIPKQEPLFDPARKAAIDLLNLIHGSANPSQARAPATAAPGSHIHFAGVPTSTESTQQSLAMQANPEEGLNGEGLPIPWEIETETQAERAQQAFEAASDVLDPIRQDGLPRLAEQYNDAVNPNSYLTSRQRWQIVSDVLRSGAKFSPTAHLRLEGQLNFYARRIWQGSQLGKIGG